MVVKYPKGALDIICLHKDSLFSIVKKGTKEAIPGLPEYSTVEEAREKIRQLEQG